jgi:hypothetical protein
LFACGDVDLHDIAGPHWEQTRQRPPDASFVLDDTHMQFTLRDLLLLCVVLASALAAFQIVSGILFFILVLLIWARKRITSPILKKTASIIICFYFLYCLFFVLLLPYNLAHELPYKAACINNLKEIGMALKTIRRRINIFHRSTLRMPRENRCIAGGRCFCPIWNARISTINWI